MVNRFLQHLKALTTWLSVIEQGIFYGRCALCGGASYRHMDICETCETELPWSNQQCRRCALPLYSDSTNSRRGLISQTDVCGQCLLFPPSFDRALTIWRYEPPIAQLISAFKYQRRYSYGRVLCELAAQRIASAYLQNAKPDYLVATPLHWRRHLRRGFNQSEHITRFFSDQLRIPVFTGVKRIKATPPQQSLASDQRRTNINNAFLVRPNSALQGCCVAIVDDVMTTGATASELARCLYGAGVTDVHVWCLARTPNR